MPEDDRNEHVENLTITDSLTDPGGTTHTGSLDGGSGTGGVNLENTDGTTLLSTDTLQAGSNLQFSDDGDGTATLDASVDTFSGSHDDLSAVGADDHHAKTTSASDLTDVSADSVSDAHHAKTQPSDIDSANWDDYEIQVDGTDGPGIINFVTE